jgi:hypothetical protein
MNVSCYAPSFRGARETREPGILPIEIPGSPLRDAPE